MLSIDKNFFEKYINGAAIYLPFVPNSKDCRTLSFNILGAINDYRIEFDVEQYRLLAGEKLPSRLSVVYAFGDYESCQEVYKKYGWELDQVRKFQLTERPFNRIATSAKLLNYIIENKRIQ